MPCPFPGMDPYLELPPFWSDFAPKFLTALSNELLGHLLPRYDVRVEEYVMLTEDDLHLHRLRPDVAISATSAWSPGGAAATVVEPSVSELEYPEYEPRTHRRLKIIHRDRLVTVIELLSPANKTPGEAGIDAYLNKRAELLTCRCHLVELDLLRGGQRLPMRGPLPPGDYYAYIGRVGRQPMCQVIGWQHRARLPTISIPLLAPDPELPLDLAGVFRAAYEPAFYDRRLPYKQPLDLPLVPADQTWVQAAIAGLPARY